MACFWRAGAALDYRGVELLVPGMDPPVSAGFAPAPPESIDGEIMPEPGWLPDGELSLAPVEYGEGLELLPESGDIGLLPGDDGDMELQAASANRHAIETSGLIMGTPDKNERGESAR